MAKLIFDLLLVGIASFVGYCICIAVDNELIAKMVIGVAVMMILLVLMQDVAPIFKGISERVSSLQNTADKITNIGQGSWEMPMKGEVTQQYKGSDHHGMDIGAPLGTPVTSARKGEVARVEWNDIYGNMIVVGHGGGMESLYGHLQGLNVKVGYPVIAGTKIGTCGSTGNSTGPHLHFEIRKNGQTVDPLPYLR